MESEDIHVYRREKGVTCVRRHFFDRPVKIARKPRHIAADGLGEVVITFAGGGTVTIFTDRPMLWVEPDRH